MKAVIMAGGEGTRLRPLTCSMPKPMARLCGRPALEYILDLLKKNGVTHAAVTLKYLPEAISGAYPAGEYEGIKLDFFEEEAPLGTAGSVKNASSVLNEDFIVISGDALCDFDLSAALRFHREKGAMATLLLSHVSDPREYGLVVTGPDGLVRGFVEKPGWAQAVSDLVNTGIYILSPQCLDEIPEGKEFDFAKDLFPLLLGKGMPICGFECDGYWCDIGDISAYASCQFDMLEGRVECRLPGAVQDGVRFKASRPAGSYRIVRPAYIGRGVVIGADAVIGPNAVLDDGCNVGFGATVKNSVVLSGAYIGDKCELRGALVCAGASLEKNAAMFEGSVAGEGAVIGRDSAVSPGVRVWPHKKVEDGARAAVNVKYGGARRGLFDDDGISGETGVELTPEICAKIGASAASVFENAVIGVGSDGSGAAEAFKNAAAAGALSAGAKVCDFGSGFESLFNFSTVFCGMKLGIFARSAGSRAILRLVGGDGLSVGRAAERKLDSVFATGDIKRCRAMDFGRPQTMAGIKLLYRQAVLSTANGGLGGMKASVKSVNREIQTLLTEILREAGCGEGPMKIHIDGSGKAASFFDENGDYIGYPRSMALACLAEFEDGGDVAVPFDAPRAIDSMAKKYGRKVLRYLDCPADKGDAAARELARTQLWVRDGLLCSVKILEYLKRRGMSLLEMSSLLPGFAVAVKAVPCGGNPGNILRSFSGTGNEKSAGKTGTVFEGVVLTEKSGNVLLRPLKRGGGLRIMAEAADMEAADDLCYEFEKKLRENDLLDRNGE